MAIDTSPEMGLVAGEASPPGTRASVEEQAPSWAAGDPVERLLDDISDIWAGAVVLHVRGEGLFDISYADDGSVECGVEGSELRPRKVRLDMPAEMWQGVGSCLCD